MQKIIASAQKSGRKYSIEHKIIWPDGSEYWVHGKGQAIMKNGSAIRIIGTFTNIDEQKKPRKS